MPPTLREIAEYAGVSIQTVSRVARGVGQVSPEVRERVTAAIELFNYRPSHFGQALVTQRHAALGIVFPGLGGPYYSEVIQGFESEAVAARLSVLILGTHRLRESRDLAEQMADRVDGIAIMGGTVGSDILHDLVERGSPVVQLTGTPVPGIPTVRTENAAAAENLTLHLIRDHDYDRLAFIGNPTGAPDTTARWDGFRAAHRHAGLRVPRQPVRVGLEQSDGIVAANTLLDSSRPPRAIVCANDETAMGALVAVLGRGKRIPEDVAITGFDGIPAAALTSPGLTTVHQPMRELGAQTARTLRSRIDNKCDLSLDVVLPTELVLRASCGCDDAEMMPLAHGTSSARRGR